MKISLLAAALAAVAGGAAPASQLATVTASVTGSPPCTSTYATGPADGTVSAAVTCQAVQLADASGAAASQIQANAPAPGPCPYASTSPVDDGCATAPKVGAFYQPAFAAFGVKPSILAKHPQTYDVPGWDYPEGQAPGDPVLQDPATAALPAGCVFSASGAPTSAGYTGGAWIACQNTSNPTFPPLDASLHGCTPIHIYPTVKGTVTLPHFYSKNGPNPGCSDSNAAQIVFEAGSTASLDLETVTLDGAYAPGQKQQNGLITFNSSGKLTGHHIAFLNSGSRPISGTCATGEALNGVVVTGMSLVGPTGAHGELSEYVINPANYCGPGPYHISIDDENVTFINPPGALAGSITAPFYLSSGQASDNVTCDFCKLANITVVSNGVTGVMGEALLNLGFQTVNQLVIQNVYVDPTGSPYCALVQATKTLGTVTVTGVTNLRDGSAITFPKPDLNGNCNGHA